MILSSEIIDFNRIFELLFKISGIISRTLDIPVESIAKYDIKVQ